MKRTTLYINKQAVRLEPDKLIQSGGEGMVFQVGKTAVKIYHQPQANRKTRLQALLDVTQQGRFPANILGPCALIQDKKGEVVGFQMPLLMPESQPIKQLSRPGYWQKSGMSAQAVCNLLGQIHEILTRLHQNNIIVGDLNDQNIFFSGSDRHGWWQSFWVDVDSYQFGRFPCPAAMQSFLDPNLYHVADFNRQPVFSAETDWFAFFVLLVKSLLQVHPYGGVHHEKQSLTSRASAGISILNSAVTYPKRARPIETLSDDLLAHMERVFERGERYPFPFLTLENYAAGLHLCSDCGLTYPQERPGCPGCQQKTPVLKPTHSLGQLESIELLKADGYIVYTTILPSGGVIAVTRSGNYYTLYQIETAGQYTTTPLFTGQGEYRFGFFDGRFLIVNPVDKTQLLVLEVSGPQLEQVEMVPTAAFRGRAVFATTPTHLIRVVQGTITKGQVRYGSFIEEVIGTARREQTWLWASPHNEMIAGYYRFFDAVHLFLLNEKGAYYEIDHPALQTGESLDEIEAIFGRNAVAYFLKVNRGGKQYLRTFVVNDQGQIIEIRENRIGSAEPFESIHGKALSHHTILHPTDGGILKENKSGKHLLADTADLISTADTLHLHPNGLLIQQPSALYLLKEIS